MVDSQGQDAAPAAIRPGLGNEQEGQRISATGKRDGQGRGDVGQQALIERFGDGRAKAVV